MRARIEELKQSLEQLTAQTQTLGEQAARHGEAVNAHRTQQAALEGEVLEGRSRLKSLQDIQADYQGFGEAVRELLQALNADPAVKADLGVLGPLGDLLQVPGDLLDWAGSYLGPYLARHGEGYVLVGDALGADGEGDPTGGNAIRVPGIADAFPDAGFSWTDSPLGLAPVPLGQPYLYFPEGALGPRVVSLGENGAYESDAGAIGGDDLAVFLDGEGR